MSLSLYLWRPRSENLWLVNMCQEPVRKQLIQVWISHGEFNKWTNSNREWQNVRNSQSWYEQEQFLPQCLKVREGSGYWTLQGEKLLWEALWLSVEGGRQAGSPTGRKPRKWISQLPPFVASHVPSGLLAASNRKSELGGLYIVPIGQFFRMKS